MAVSISNNHTSECYSKANRECACIPNTVYTFAPAQPPFQFLKGLVLRLPQPSFPSPSFTVLQATEDEWGRLTNDVVIKCWALAWVLQAVRNLWTRLAVHGHCYLPSFQRELSSGSHRSSGGSSGSKGKSSTNLKSKDRVLSGGSGECGPGFVGMQQLGEGAEKMQDGDNFISRRTHKLSC